jgi:hypothetical protein
MTKKRPDGKEVKWKPKGFIMDVTIDIKTGKTTPGKPIFAKTQEEEERMEKEFSERWADAMKIIWGDKFDWFVENAKYLIDKYGEKEFIKRWNNAMKEK